MKVFIIDFSNDTEIEKRISQDIEIYRENIDGGQAYKSIGELMPELIFVNFNKKPSHGLQTAISVRQRKRTSQIPILFLDNDQKNNDKMSEIGEVITYEDIETRIQLARNTSH
jgi:PleD family two-component response regulator